MKEYVILGVGDDSYGNEHILFQWVKKNGLFLKYFVDNESSNIGKNVYNYVVKSINSLLQEDKSKIFILIASTNYSLVGLQLMAMGFKKDIHFKFAKEFLNNQEKNYIKDNKFSNTIEKGKFYNIHIETINKCNANCPYCSTGRMNIDQVLSKTSILSSLQVRNIIQYLKKNQMIEKNCYVCLYNWGEPFLNKNLPQIVEVLREEEMNVEISTNCSNITLIDDFKTCNHIKNFIVSMSGFSQNSYDKIHGFNFMNIKNNIEYLASVLKAKDFVGKLTIAFHIYKFNWNEIELAKEFFDMIKNKYLENYDVKFNPYYAGLNGHTLFYNYIEGSMESNLLESVNKDLFLDYIETLKSFKPNCYECPSLSGRLVIDAELNVRVCCGNEMSIIGNLFSLKRTEILDKIKNNCYCNKCKTTGLDFIAYHYTPKLQQDKVWNPLYKK